MNRMALATSLAVVLVTLAAFVNHVQTRPLPGEEAPPMTERLPVLMPLAAVEAPTPRAAESKPKPPALTTAKRAAIEARVRKEIVSPLQKSRFNHRRFSRVMLPVRNLKLKMEDYAIHAPKEDAPEFVLFELQEVDELRTRVDKKARVLAHGRVQVATGTIELSVLRRGKQSTTRDWQPAVKALPRLGLLR